MVSLWDTVRSPTISPSLPMSLWKQRSSRLITAPRRIIRCDHRIQRWKSFTQWVSLTFLKRAQTVGSLFYWRYKWLLLSKSKVLPTLKLWWTENKQAQFMKKYNFHLHVTPLSWGQLQQHWWWTYPSRGKQGFLQILFLFTPVSCAECIDSISYFLNHKTRCAPSRPIYRDWINAI